MKNEERQKKTKEQIEILENEFEKDPAWSKHKMNTLASNLGLKMSQIYKWNWDRRMALESYLKKNYIQNHLFIVVRKKDIKNKGHPVLFSVSKQN